MKTIKHIAFLLLVSPGVAYFSAGVFATLMLGAAMSGDTLYTCVFAAFTAAAIVEGRARLRIVFEALFGAALLFEEVEVPEELK